MCPDCRSPYGYCHAWCQHQADVIESTSAARGILTGVLWGLVAWAVIAGAIAAACLFAAHHPSTHSVFVVFLLAALGYLLTTPSNERH